MIKLIKTFLHKILGLKAYLRCLHVGFFVLYDLGFLKNNRTFKFHYFVKHLIKNGDCVVDIGANLGYFSKIFSRLAGSNGKVICIEPVKPFFETLHWGLRNKKNAVLYNYALGLENKKVELTLPITKGPMRTGLSHIATNEPDKAKDQVFEAEMVKGSSLLENELKIDYIKCDIEGYEEFVIPEIKGIIEKHKPMIQIESFGTHKEVVFKLLEELGYSQFTVYKNKLVEGSVDNIEFGDYLFIHSNSAEKILTGLRGLKLF